MIVDQHQPVVEKYYGPGKMRIVVKRLLQECDRVTKGIIDGWEEERLMKRKVYSAHLLPVGISYESFSSQISQTTHQYQCSLQIADANRLL